MLFMRFIGLLAILGVWLPSFAAVPDQSPDQWAAQGRLEEAASAWGREGREREGSERIVARFYQGLMLQQLGLHREAQAALSEALTPGGLPEVAQRVQGLTALAYSLSRLGQTEAAETSLSQAGTLAQTAIDRARVALTDGRLRWEREDHESALARFEEARGLSAGDARLRATVALLGTQAMPHDKPSMMPKALAWLREGFKALDGEPPVHEVLYLRIGLLRGLFLLAQTLGQSERAILFQEIREGLTEAARVAKAEGNTRSRTYALGYLGELSEAMGQPQAALSQTREAVFIAQAASLTDPLYRWHWQAGRLLGRQAGQGGDLGGAITAYQEAVTILDTIRQDVTASLGGLSQYRRQIGPVYLEYADLLLRRAATRSRDRSLSQQDLRASRDVMERLKTVELQDYFKDECLTAFSSRVEALDRLDPHAALLYPILLTDRLELVVSVKGELHQFTYPIPAERLIATLRDLRRFLEKRVTRQFMPLSQKVYDWLIRPLEPLLTGQGITTLVMVPDGALRGIPLTALHDGQGFLVERYAVVVSPGLTLTDPHATPSILVRPLLSGITEAVQGFPALPSVGDELTSIAALYQGKQLRDGNFVADSFQRELAATPYSVVHIASHGQFRSDIRQTFLLTYDQHLTLDRLEKSLRISQYRDNPVELLTLSACETAAGDDRAALGLAGVAIKAGARSAVASLWLVNDQATAILIGDFYHHLRQGGLDKALALRRAQMDLMKDPRYRHPAYWAPFLLIGNWL